MNRNIVFFSEYKHRQIEIKHKKNEIKHKKKSKICIEIRHDEKMN